ncbi:DNA replication and repair protein RecF [mine drainage metagenome]|uniref:DNA replication and repair protein RecF n=1 Tax=mine drainage metagenome TaxID=410659 RepID=A0A1J5TMM4_9ZZZZ
MYLKKIIIKDIRSIKDIEITFNEPYNGWHVLIGDNGSGKSSIIKSICVALVGTDEAESLREDWSKWINKSAKEAQISLELIPDYEFDSPQLRKKRVQTVINKIDFVSKKTQNIFSNGISLDFSKEENDPYDYNWAQDKVGWFSAAYGPYRKFTGGGNLESDFSFSHPKAAAHLSAFGDELGLNGAIDWLIHLRFRSLEKNTQNGKLYTELLDSFVTFINNSELLPYNSKVTQVTSNGVLIKDALGNEISLYEMSDGYKTVISMIFDIIFQLIKTYGAQQVFEQQKNGYKFIDLPGIILIDEVDAHLHPKWQIKIGESFKRIFPKIQFIVTTHSPLICRSVKENNSIWLLPSLEQIGKSYREILGTEKQKLVDGNILDAYGTDIFGKATVRSKKSEEKLERLGVLNMMLALGKISESEKDERNNLLKIFGTDDPIG